MNMRKTLMLAFVALTSSAWAETPDFIADTLTSDGAGYIDTHYCYKRAASTSPKTAKVVLDYYDTDCCGYSDSRVSKTGRRTYFGFWMNGKVDKSQRHIVEYNNQKAQILGCNGTSVSVTGLTSGDLSVTLDYAHGTGVWDSVAFNLPDVGAADLKSISRYCLFARNLNGKADAFGIYDFKRFRIYESADDGATETLVRDFVPAYLNGEVGVYDRETERFHPALTKGDGFILSGYDIDLAAGKTLNVTAGCATPRTLKLAAGATLAFDGKATLTPTATAELPSSGAVTVSLAQTGGKGRYVLLDNLPSDYDLARFALGATPTGTTGTLAKDGTKLVLTLVAPSAPVILPEALCAYITSDRTNHIDTLYHFTNGTPIRTSRVQMDFETVNYGLFPSATTNTWNGIFGYLYSDGGNVQSRCNFRKVSDYFWCQIWEGSTFTNHNGRQSIVLDYLNLTGQWDDESGAIKLPSKTRSELSYFVAGVNSTTQRCYMDIRRFRIWETNTASEVESLALDLVPCVSGGRPALYDTVAGTIHAPTNPVNSYTYAKASWRLTMGGDVGFYPEGTAVTIACPTETSGYVLVNDNTGAIWQKGAGSTLALTMPAFPVSVYWTAPGNASVGAGETLNVSGTMCYSTLTLAAGATLAFAADSRLLLSEGLVLPAAGQVRITAAGMNLPGTYVLAAGVADSVDLNAFAFVPSDYGLKGTVGREGDRLVLTLVEDASVSGALAGCTLTSDDDGWIDTGYHYKNGTDKRTSYIQFDFTTVNYGRKPKAAFSKFECVFGYYSGHVKGVGIQTYFRYSAYTDARGRNLGISMSGGGGSFTNANGRQRLEIDYLNGKVIWNQLESITNEERAVTIPSTQLEDRSFYLAGVNGNNTPGYIDIHRFQVWESDGDGQNAALAMDLVPAAKAGAIGVYDRVAKTFIEPTTTNVTHGFKLDMGTVTQEFAVVSTVCEGQFVTRPDFAPQNVLTFTADGVITARRPIEKLTLTRYDASGAVLSTEDAVFTVAGQTVEVVLDGAARVTVEITGATCGTVAQVFTQATTESADALLERKVSRYACDYMVPGAATFVFNTSVEKIEAELYDAAGTKIGEETLSGVVSRNTPFAVAAHATAAYRVLHVTFLRPGTCLVLR